MGTVWIYKILCLRVKVVTISLFVDA
jgi:hypothetical protein